MAVAASGAFSAFVFGLGAQLRFLAAVPLLVAALRHGPGVGVRAGAVGAALVAVQASAVAAAGGAGVIARVLLVYGVVAATPAALLAWSLGRGRTADRAIAEAAMALLSVLGAAMAVAWLWPGSNPALWLRSEVGQGLDAVLGQLRDRAWQGEGSSRLVRLAALQARRTELERWAVWLAPALVSLAVVVGLWVTVLYARWLTGRGAGAELLRWRLPKAGLGWVMVCAAGVISQQLGTPWSSSAISAGAVGGLVFLGGLYALQGVAVVNEGLRRLTLGPLGRWTGLLAQVALISALPGVFAAIGLTDAWFDLRRLDRDDRTGDGR